MRRRVTPHDIDNYRDKSLLVGITYLSGRGDLVRTDSFLSRIVRLAPNGGLVVERTGGGEVELPPEFEDATPGEYRLRETGEVVVNPDFLATWTRSERRKGDD